MDSVHRPQRLRKGVEHYSDDNPSTFTDKLRRGEQHQPRPQPAPRRAPSPLDSAPNTRKRRLRVIPPPPPEIKEDIISHAASIRPVLPLELLDRSRPTSSSGSVSPTASSAYDALLSLPNVPEKPDWCKVPSAYSGSLLQRRFGSTVVEVPPPAVTCCAVQQSTGDYLAVGDVAGGVTIYETHCRTHPLVRLETSAWKREQKRSLDSKKTISYPNAVQQVSWRNETIVLQTAEELEVFIISDAAWHEQAVRTIRLDSSRPGMWSGNLDVLSTSNNKHHILWATGGRRLERSLTTRSSMGKDNKSRGGVTTLSNASRTPNGGSYVRSVAELGAEIKRDAEMGFGKSDTRELADDDIAEMEISKIAAEHKVVGDKLTSRSNVSTPEVAQEICKDDGGDDETVGADSSLVRFCIDGESLDERNEAFPIEPDETQDWTVLTAIWDASRFDNVDEDPILLAVAWSKSDAVEVVRCGALTRKTSEREQVWSVSANSSMSSVIGCHCHIQQTTKFIFLAGGFKGIKLLDIATLKCVQTIGDTAALHGKNVQWHSFEYVRRPGCANTGDLIRRQKKQEWIERPDEVHRRSSIFAKQSLIDEENAYLIVGLPHPRKGPEEMRSTLHVWQLGIVNPIATLQTPKGGCLGMSIRYDTLNGGWKLVCATADSGELWELRSSFRTNFAGVMYPVGYQVVNDNIEYVEDEDELDKLAVVEFERSEPLPVPPRKRGRPPAAAVRDDDLQKAMELSLMEEKKSHDVFPQEIDVMSFEHGFQRGIRIPCIPDKSFRPEEESIKNRKVSSGVSPKKKDGFDSEVLLELPQTRHARQSFARLKQQQDALAQQVSTFKDISIAPAKVKGKRTNNVEALLLASVNPELHDFMGKSQSSWSIGRGHFRPKPRASTPRTFSIDHNGQTDSSGQEQELALELLHLGPGKSERPMFSPHVSFSSAFADVTMSDGSAHVQLLNDDSHMPSEGGMEEGVESCSACRGRMVVHTCGKREQPVDYDALERAEQLRKEREEEEKKRKRKLKDAQRRAKKKKEDEEKKRKEEERIRQLHKNRFDQAHIGDHREGTLGHQHGRLLYQENQVYPQGLVQTSSTLERNGEWRPRPNIHASETLKGSSEGIGQSASSTSEGALGVANNAFRKPTSGRPSPSVHAGGIQLATLSANEAEALAALALVGENRLVEVGATNLDAEEGTSQLPIDNHTSSDFAVAFCAPMGAVEGPAQNVENSQSTVPVASVNYNSSLDIDGQDEAILRDPPLQFAVEGLQAPPPMERHPSTTASTWGKHQV